MSVLITGGCGFIGTNFIEMWLKLKNEPLINVDKLTYAANLKTKDIKDERYSFIELDVNDTTSLRHLLKTYKPRVIIHFAAETHVDRSIQDPKKFILTNINGTHSLLEASLDYFSNLSEAGKAKFKIINISTDEVYGTLNASESGFTEQSRIDPSSPYSASKAGADLIGQSFYRTYQLPVITTRCSNNFGPHQNSEKFIPKVIASVLAGNRIPIYGSGKQIRDWLFVSDHIEALMNILDKANPGSVFNIGGGLELENLELAKKICWRMAIQLEKVDQDFGQLINHVCDRPGHDFRYAIDSSLAKAKLGWSARYDFDKALDLTIDSFVK